MTFNFGSLATTQAVSTSKPRLKPWGIYPVKFMGARKETIQGRKDPSASYEVLRIRFEGADGFYEESIFFPKEGDDVRPKYTNKEGHEAERPSSFERTMAIIAQTAEVLNPEGWKKMQAASSKFRTFDDVATVFIKITDQVKNKETNIKLTGKNSNGTIVPSLPMLAIVDPNTGAIKVTNNYIGDDVYFSSYEEGKRKEFESATPTKMNDSGIAQDIDGVGAGSEDIDFNALL